MNKTNQFSAKTQYVTPWCRCAEVKFARLICASGDSSRYGGSYHAGGDMEETDEHTYDF